MPQVSRPFPLAATTATTTVSATAPPFGVLQRAVSTTPTTAVSTTLTPACTGTTETRTAAFRSVVSAIRADRKSAKRQSGLKGKTRRKEGDNLNRFRQSPGYYDIWERAKILIGQPTPKGVVKDATGDCKISVGTVQWLLSRPFPLATTTTATTTILATTPIFGVKRLGILRNNRQGSVFSIVLCATIIAKLKRPQNFFKTAPKRGNKKSVANYMQRFFIGA